MGWDSFVGFDCDITEQSMRQQVDLMVSSGLRDAGYDTFVLACGWQGTDRPSDGSFQINSKTFPSGMTAMANYIHDRKMQFGLTSTVGVHACGTRVKAKRKMMGAKSYELSDAKTFVGWGIDFLKMEACWADNAQTPIDYNPTYPIKDMFALTRDALKTLGRPVTLGISAWGIQNPLSWPVKDYANIWRLGDDTSGKLHPWYYILRTINQFAAASWANEPGTFADLDLLELGHLESTISEQITQFSFWAAAKSPLFISAHLSWLPPHQIEHYKNKEVIAINQDPLGASIRLNRRYTDQIDVWSGPLKDGSLVVAIINFLEYTHEVNFNLADVGLASASIRDIWASYDYGQRNTSIIFEMAGHGIQLLKLTSMVTIPPIKYQDYPAIGPNCDLYGAAVERTTDLGLKVASNVGKGSYIQWHDIDGGNIGGRKHVTLNYIMADSELVVPTTCPRCREAYICLNDGPTIKLNFPSSGSDWHDVYWGYVIELDGFVAGAANKIKLSNDQDLAPDFVSMGIQI
ncbi:hypothetical protein CROQUDRAFT_661389 [Cronartium quercuum f. sp. fusiforme G11]|uniref:Alpha-galactosidase n=1 Tax=Cronartium quercuum f. sp. fusiforme G11 TaxID=708437 RepID=A0A9P6NC03_9BASI|nr:hypothetical protein CROQUDRAFT_661389 [Cronartium quercuum f. sp. fusiforme G11]